MTDDNDPSVFTEAGLAMIEKAVPLSDRFAYLDRVPTKPGRYVDQEGDEWLLTEDNRWIDHNGHTEDTAHNWMLGVTCKFRRVSE